MKLNKIVLVIATLTYGAAAFAGESLATPGPQVVCASQEQEVLKLSPIEAAEQGMIRKTGVAIGTAAAFPAVVYLTVTNSETEKLVQKRQILSKIAEYSATSAARRDARLAYSRAQRELIQFMVEYGVYDKFREMRRSKKVNADNLLETESQKFKEITSAPEEMEKRAQLKQKITMQFNTLRHNRVQALATMMSADSKLKNVLYAIAHLDDVHPNTSPLTAASKTERMAAVRSKSAVFEARFERVQGQVRSLKSGRTMAASGGLAGAVLGFTVFIASESLASSYEGASSGIGEMSDAELEAYDLAMNCLTEELRKTESPLNSNVEITTRIRGKDEVVPFDAPTLEALNGLR